MASRADNCTRSFEAVLASLRWEQDPGGWAGTVGKPFAAFVHIADENLTYGFAALVEGAFQDCIADGATLKPLPPIPSDDVERIASELALGGIADPAALRNLRRRFLWANHPDRRPDLPRDLANRRVAIANMLIDRALKEISPRRR